MKIEDLWFHRKDSYESELRRVEADGELYWSIRVSEMHTNYGGQAEIDLDRKALKDLHGAIEQELYPERYFPEKEKYGTDNPAIIAHEKRVEKFQAIAKLMEELGLAGDTITRLSDAIQAEEYVRRETRNVINEGI